MTFGYYKFLPEELPVLQKIQYPFDKAFVSQTNKVNFIKATAEKIQQLNNKFRNIDEPTDVLSFKNPSELGPGGDVYLCVGVIKENAKRFGIPFEEELLRTAIHGVLHLLGYGHKGKFGEGDEEMFQLQEKILQESLKQS